MGLRRLDFRIAANLALLAAVCLVFLIVTVLIDSLGSDRWSTAIGDGIGWGFYLGVILWFMMLPGCLVYIGVVVALAHSHRSLSRWLAIALSPGLAVLPAWLWSQGAHTNLLIPWMIGVAVAFGVVYRLPRERPLASIPSGTTVA